MKVKFVNIRSDYQFRSKGKVVKVGDIVDVPKRKGEELIARGVAEMVDEKPKKNSKEKGGQ